MKTACVNNVVKRSYQTIPSHLPYWIGLLFSTIQPTPSIRRPVSVKPISCFPLFLSSSLFLLFPYCSHRAKPPLSPPFHPHSLLSDCRSVQVGCTRFSRCCYLIIDLYSPLSKGSLARSWSQSPDLGGRARLFGCYPLLFFAP